MSVKLRIDKVSKRFADSRTGAEVHAIDEVSLDVSEQEFVALLGPSGCGKTTLLRIVAGLEDATTGRVLLAREGALVERSEPGPECGMVFQEHFLFPWRTARANIEFGLEFIEPDRERRAETARRYLHLTNLERFADRYPHELSGGMRQRVALARALAPNPEVLLLDEPFAALDAQTRSFFQDELLQIWNATRKTVLLVTHSIEEAVYLADRVVVLGAHPGRIVEIKDIPWPRPRRKTSPEFLEVIEGLWGFIAAAARREAAE